MTNKQTQTFQAETKELLNLMIHSLYSHREIFLRELISNAADAIEKLKFESLTDSSLAASMGNLEIRLDPNPEAKTLTITDTGIGMTYDEVVQNIGTIAHSGTKAFAKMRQELKSNPELIGQFGVGFYSAFMVAKKMTLHTRKAGAAAEDAVLWESDGLGSYTIEKVPREQGHGTTLVIYLKDAAEEAEEGKESQAADAAQEHQDFTDTWTLKGLVKKYSDFVPYPIKMGEETLNSQKALWLKSPSEITQPEYDEFYKHLSHDWTPPLKTVHYRAEGTTEFSAILYIPSQKPHNYDYRDNKIGLSLYVKRVFIKSDCSELVPPYLRFVKGMVDSDDLSLNVSREILQQDRQIVRIKKALTGKIMATLKDMLDSDRAGYEKFWKNFGASLKEGIAMDPAASATKDKLQDLLLYNSTASDGLTTLREYVDRMKPEQKAIYYITGEALSQIKNSPYLEKLRAKNYEVLLMTDGVDGWAANALAQYAEKPLQSITGSHLDVDTEEEKKQSEQKLKDAEVELRPLMDTMKNALKDQVKEIKFSERLTDSPVCLVSEDAMSAQMERMMQSMGQPFEKTKRTLEINPSHPLYGRMLKVSQEQQMEWAEILYDQALLNEGSQIADPHSYSLKIARLMMNAPTSMEMH